jgi:hypothetical protein
MAAKIGLNFGNELLATGQGDMPISWNSEGEFFGREKLTPEQNAILDEVIANHDPETPLPSANPFAELRAEIEALKSKK